VVVEDFRNRQRGQLPGVRRNPDVHAGHEQSPQRCEGLRAAERDLLLPFIGKQFGEPRDGGDEFHTHADERRATEEEKHRQAGTERRGEGRKGVEENARRHDGLAPKPINQPAAQQSENPAAKRGHPKQVAKPPDDDRVVRRQLQQLGNRRHGHQRRHQQFVSVEEEAYAGDGEDKPGSQGKFGRPGFGRIHARVYDSNARPRSSVLYVLVLKVAR